MYAQQRIAVVVPAYQEAVRIGRVVRTLPSWIDDVIVVDDASHDGTAAAARKMGDPRVECLIHEKNRGVGAAIVSGYRRARAKGADILVVMAGDGQMDPADLPALLEPIASGIADYVKGNRLWHQDSSRMPLVRRLGTATFGILTGWAIGVAGLSDSQCGYTAIAGSLVDRLPLSRLYGRYGYPNDLLSHVALAGGRIGEVPVRPIYAGEASGLRWRHAVTVMALIVRARLRRMGAEYIRKAPAPSR